MRSTRVLRSYEIINLTLRFAIEPVPLHPIRKANDCLGLVVAMRKMSSNIREADVPQPPEVTLSRKAIAQGFLAFSPARSIQR